MPGSDLWLALVPFAAFATAFCVGALALWFIAKRTKIVQTETRYGKALHVESPVGTMDVHPEPKLDARLARIPVYPGAISENPSGAESVSEGGRTLEEISSAYWTPDGEQVVWNYYRSSCRTGP